MLNPRAYPVFVEGAGHPVPQRAELPPHLGAFLHLLCPVLLILVSDQTSREAEMHIRQQSRLLVSKQKSLTRKAISN